MENRDIASQEASPKKKRAIYHVGKLQHVIGKRWTEPEINALADELIDYMEADDSRLWIKSFFTKRRITKRAITSMRQRSEYFAECYELALSIQEERLLDKGINTNNSTIIFALKNCHGWTERPALDVEEVFVMIDNWSGNHNSNKSLEGKK